MKTSALILFVFSDLIPFVILIIVAPGLLWLNGCGLTFCLIAAACGTGTFLVSKLFLVPHADKEIYESAFLRNEEMLHGESIVFSTWGSYVLEFDDLGWRKRILATVINLFILGRLVALLRNRLGLPLFKQRLLPGAIYLSDQRIIFVGVGPILQGPASRKLLSILLSNVVSSCNYSELLGIPPFLSIETLTREERFIIADSPSLAGMINNQIPSLSVAKSLEINRNYLESEGIDPTIDCAGLERLIKAEKTAKHSKTLKSKSFQRNLVDILKFTTNLELG